VTAQPIVIPTIASIDGGIDRQFVKTYKKFLCQFNDLRDCGYFAGLDGGKHLYRFSDGQLAEFRACYELPLIPDIRFVSIKQANATKCKPATVAGNRS